MNLYVPSQAQSSRSRPATVDEFSREALAIARVQIDAAALDDASEQGRTLTVPEAVTLALA